MSKPMTHLEAFTSEDAKRGRVWTDGFRSFRRDTGMVQRSYSSDDNSHNWITIEFQVAAMEGEVRRADEPKTLAPQEALRALADGEYIRPCGGIADLIYRLFDDELMAWDTCMMPYKWRYTRRCSLKECVVVPDPSKTPSERICQAMDAATWNPAPSEKFTLTFLDAEKAAMRGAVVANSEYRHIRYAIFNGDRISYVGDRRILGRGGWKLYPREEMANWRVVEWKDGEK